MTNWFEVKVKYEKIDERGAVKKVTEPYLVDALTFTEAEARAIAELEPYLSGEFIISNIGRAVITDLFPFDDGDRWFKCKIAYVSIDEEKGTEKRKTSYVFVQANDLKHAWDNLTKAMSDSVVDYEVKKIEETAVMDVFPYTAGDDAPKEALEGYVPEGATPEFSEDDMRIIRQVMVFTEKGSELSASTIQKKHGLGYRRANRILLVLEHLKSIEAIEDSPGCYRFIDNMPDAVVEAFVKGQGVEITTDKE